MFKNRVLPGYLKSIIRKEQNNSLSKTEPRSPRKQALSTAVPDAHGTLSPKRVYCVIPFFFFFQLGRLAVLRIPYLIPQSRL